MPTYVVGDIWQAPQDYGATVIAVPTNAVINRRGELVMGAGFAKAAAERWPWLPAAAGAAVCRDREIATGPRHQVTTPYGWLYVDGGIGLFQTKAHYRSGALLDLIQRSTWHLGIWLALFPNPIVAMPMPGVGLGGLRRDDVLPVLAGLPERVIVFEREG